MRERAAGAEAGAGQAHIGEEGGDRQAEEPDPGGEELQGEGDREDQQGEQAAARRAGQGPQDPGGQAEGGDQHREGQAAEAAGREPEAVEQEQDGEEHERGAADRPHQHLRQVNVLPHQRQDLMPEGTKTRFGRAQQPQAPLLLDLRRAQARVGHPGGGPSAPRALVVDVAPQAGGGKAHKVSVPFVQAKEQEEEKEEEVITHPSL